MKRKLFLVCLFLVGTFATQAQNLIENGSFEEGKKNWVGANITTSDGRIAKDGQNFLETEEDSWGFGPYNANARYNKQVATGIGGKTYTFSLWVYKNTDMSQLAGNLQVVKEDGSGDYTSENGLSFGNFKFEKTGKTEKEGKWEEVSATIVFKDIHHTIKSLGLNFKKERMRVDDVQFVEMKSLEDVEVTDYQREVLITWATATGVTSYNVKVGNTSPTEVTDNKYLVTGLEPGSTTTITVSAQGFSPVKVVAKTVSSTTLEAERIPYVKFMDGAASTSFYPSIFDSTNAPADIKVFLDGAEVTAGSDGFYALTAGDNKKLKVTFNDGTQAYELMYIVTVK